MISFLVVLLMIFLGHFHSTWAKFVFRVLGLFFCVVLTIRSSRHLEKRQLMFDESLFRKLFLCFLFFIECMEIRLIK